MPRFYFHLRNDVIADDHEGQELPDLAAAREVAIMTSRELAAESVRQGSLCLDHYIEIENEYHVLLAKVTFKEAVMIKGQGV